MRPLIDAFARGMGDLIAPAWLGLFNAKEFNQVKTSLELNFFELSHLAG
jgi:ubiquitin-protein ligase E3 B